MREGFLAACALAAACSCASPQPSVIVAELAASSAPPAPVLDASSPPPAEDLFTPDPPLEGLDPHEACAFRQETWTGAGESQQHCRELAYPARLRDEILRQTNDALAVRGVPPRLPDTVRQAPLVIAFTEFTPTLVEPAEPLVKLLLCTEGKAPRALRDRFVEGLRRRGLVPALPFGEPDLAWRRLHQDRREEVGFRWSNLKPEDVESAFVKLGFTQSGDPPTWRRPGVLAQGRLRGSALWWSAAP